MHPDEVARLRDTFYRSGKLPVYLAVGLPDCRTQLGSERQAMKQRPYNFIAESPVILTLLVFTEEHGHERIALCRTPVGDQFWDHVLIFRTGPSDPAPATVFQNGSERADQAARAGIHEHFALHGFDGNR